MTLPKSLTTVTPFSKTLAMVLFVALPFMGFFLGMRYQKMQDLYEKQIWETESTLVRKPTPTPEKISNWKTYSNKNMMFEFKYPRQYTMKITEESINKLVVGIDQFSLWGFWISTDKDTSFIDYNSLLTCKIVLEQIKQNPGVRPSCLEVGSNFGQKQDIANVTLGGTPAKSFYESSTGMGGTFHIIQTVNNPKIQIYIYPGNPVNQTIINFNNVVSQILSTFRFTDQNQASGTSCGDHGEDIKVCQFITQIQSAITSSDFQTLISNQQQPSITCSQEFEVRSAICSGAASGEKRVGYRIAPAYSEFYSISKEDYIKFLTDYFSKNALVIYQMQIQPNQSKLIYFDKKSTFISFVLNNSDGQWQIAYMIYGTTDAAHPIDAVISL